MDGFSTWDVCEMTGASYRQLDYWDRIGILSPTLHAATGSGTRRRYSLDDVRRAAVVLALRCMDSTRRFEYWKDAVGLLEADPDAEHLVLGAMGEARAFRDLVDAVEFINTLTSGCTLISIDKLFETVNVPLEATG